MKKTICILLALIMMAVCFAGCAAEKKPAEPEASAKSEPVETPAPTPEPFTIAAAADDELFIEGVKSVAGDSLVTVLDGEDFSEDVKRAEQKGAKCLIAFANSESENINALKSFAQNNDVLLFDAENGASVEGVMTFGFDTSSAQQSIFDTIMTLPNHDTPVRLFGMFSSAASDAASYYINGIDQGKIFDKGCYVEDENEATPEEWIAKKLGDYFPGMLDAIYAEDQRMAEIALEALEELDRSDVEVVSVFDEIPAEEMKEHKYVYRAEVCPNSYYIGAYLASCALKIRDKEEVSPVVFTPEVITAEMLDGGLMTDNMKEKFPF